MQVIRKKEFLNNKMLYTAQIPPGTIAVEDWAYANCTNLGDIYIPCSVENVSPKAFKGCDKLTDIYIYGRDAGDIINNAPHLLALSVLKWPEKTTDLIRKSHDDKKFLEEIDLLLTEFLEEPDEAGFDPFPAGGEEDYEGEENDLPLFIQRKQELKVHFIYERLRVQADGETEPQSAGQASVHTTFETASVPSAEITAVPAAETAAVPATETAAEPAAETAAVPATETAAEPATETAAEPAAETAAVPATQTTHYITYLRAHSATTSFTFLHRHTAHENEYRRIYLDLKIPGADNISQLVRMCEDDVEFKSMLIRYGREQRGEEESREDVFSKKYDL